MSYEATVAAADGAEYIMVKSFMIIARDIAQSWYSNLLPGSIDSWGASMKSDATTSRASALQQTIPWNYSCAPSPKENPSMTSSEGSPSSEQGHQT
jgi:hypothetical protein